MRFFRPTREYREMSVLREIARDERASQRRLARAAGVSAAMVNAYIDDLVSRGLLVVTGLTNRTYRYHLTLEGHARRDRLLGELAAEMEQLVARVRRELVGSEAA